MNAVMLAVLLSAAPTLIRSDTGQLGAVKLGATQKQLEAQGYKPGKIPGWFTDGTHDARVVDGAVVAIDYQLSAGEAEAIAKKKAPALEDVALALGKCGPVQANIGATVIDCEGSLKVMQHLGGMMLRLEKGATKPAQLCDAYLVKESRDLPAGNVCLGGRVLSTATTLESVEKDMSWGACETVTKGAVATRRCRGTHLVFDAAKKLARVEFH